MSTEDVCHIGTGDSLPLPEISAHSALQLPSAPGLVFASADGNQVDGDVRVFTSYGHFNKQLDLEATQSSALCSAGQSVGRVFARCKTSSEDQSTADRWWTGSAVRVSEGCLVTAWHVVKDTHEITGTNDDLCGKTFVRDKVWVYFGCSCVVDADIALGDKMHGCFEVEVLPRVAEQFFSSAWTVQGANHQAQWDTVNDFAFLKFVNDKPDLKDVPYLVPSVTQTPLTGNVFVIGYPGAIGRDQFKKKKGLRSASQRRRAI